MRQNLDRMLVFAAVVEAGSFTEAALNLGLSKSVVSHHISKLESELGTKLLNRTTRNLSLTEAGEHFYLRCREVSKIARVAVEEVQNLSTTIHGPIVITIPHALLSHSVGVKLMEFFERYPLLEPTVINDDLRRELIEEQIDLAITVGTLPDSSFKSLRVGTLTEALFASPQYLEKNPVLDNPPEYIANQWEGTVILQSYERADGTRRVFQAIATRKANNIVTVQNMAKAGLGLARLPLHMVEQDVSEGQLVRLFPDDIPITSAIRIQHAYGRQMPKKIRACIDYLGRIPLTETAE
ncbi:LysR family transcriptional regulator [Kiloniella laminariae]|uniref:LysR family transcriptional regulator n=1 Tax=Kiloniella laminariae TaxID=454162 RepID=A0ABT4LLX6_9PROT|nr:LysR family transcriptional regulator [Kiloniella laminariae]MCZ4282130.1 LysR family transcriptional regulator [Kiloniella laminariae]